MGEFGDEPNVADINDDEAVVETADEYGIEPEPANVPAPEDVPQQEVYGA